MKIAGTLSISEEGLSGSPVFQRSINNQMMADFSAKEAAAGGSTVLPSGEMEITSRVIVEFLLK
jgi:hypothetical protein